MSEDRETALQLLKERYPDASYHFASQTIERPQGEENEAEFFVFLTGAKGNTPHGKSNTSWVDAVEDIERRKEQSKVDPEELERRKAEERLEQQKISDDLTLIASMFKAMADVNEQSNDCTFGFYTLRLIADRLEKADELLAELTH